MLNVSANPLVVESGFETLEGGLEVILTDLNGVLIVPEKRAVREGYRGVSEPVCLEALPPGRPLSQTVGINTYSLTDSRVDRESRPVLALHVSTAGPHYDRYELAAGSYFAVLVFKDALPPDDDLDIPDSLAGGVVWRGILFTRPIEIVVN